MPSDCTDPISLTNLCVALSARKRTSFRTLQQQYGDGYMARRQDGLNPVAYTWDVSTPPMDFNDALNFEEELIANGTQPFDWTPPGETTEEKYIVDPVSWEWSWQTTDLATISFTLKRWYT
jgi:phage-related protein